MQESFRESNFRPYSAIPLTNPFTYTAREAAEAGLMYYRARYLSTGIGRFASEDPEQVDEEYNFYRYVGNKPIHHSDPFGLHASPSPHPKCPTCGSAGGPNIDEAAGRACDIISTPHCQKKLGPLAACMTNMCRNVQPNLVCDSYYCQIGPDRPGYSPGAPIQHVIEICTKHRTNQSGNGRARTIFHELIHQCLGPEYDDKRHQEWKTKYTDPCFTGGK